MERNKLIRDIVEYGLLIDGKRYNEAEIKLVEILALFDKQEKPKYGQFERTVIKRRKRHRDTFADFVVVRECPTCTNGNVIVDGLFYQCAERDCSYGTITRPATPEEVARCSTRILHSIHPDNRANVDDYPFIRVKGGGRLEIKK